MIAETEKGRVKVNPQYNIACPGSLASKIAAYQRRKMFVAYLRATAAGADDTVLDIGATSDRGYDHSNYLEAWYPYKNCITALGIDDASFLQSAYPGLTFVQGDGRELPFADRSFDFVHSSAVLEHVGSRERQRIFLREAWRVARKGIFMTTPNRWFPVEFHTVLPLVHWLPASVFHWLLVRLGKDFFAREENLNLLSRRELAMLACGAGIERFDVTNASLFGWPTNLLLCAIKRPARSEGDDKALTVERRAGPAGRTDGAGRSNRQRALRLAANAPWRDKHCRDPEIVGS